MLGCPSIYYRRKANVWVRVAVHGPVEEAKKQVGECLTHCQQSLTPQPAKVTPAGSSLVSLASPPAQASRLRTMR